MHVLSTTIHTMSHKLLLPSAAAAAANRIQFLGVRHEKSECDRSFVLQVLEGNLNAITIQNY